LKVVIVGAGEVGFHIASHLTVENKEVVVVDNCTDAIQRVSDNLDVQVVQGSGSSPVVLDKAGIRNAEVILAVTDSDETNLVACLVANMLSPSTKKMARVRDGDFDQYHNHFREAAPYIDTIINPEVEVVKTIESMLSIPGAADVGELADGRIKFIGIYMDQNSRLAGAKLAELPDKITQVKLLIAAVVREEELIIPTGNDYLMPGDLVYFVSEEDQLKETLEAFDKYDQPLKRALIVGGGNIGFRLAKQLEQNNNYCKIIENNPSRCAEIAEELTRTVVLCGDGSDQALLAEENIKNVDVVITLTNSEETNILASLLAKRMGAKKAIAKISKFGYFPIMKTIGIEKVVSTRLSAINTILRHIRKGKVFSAISIKGEQAEIMETLALETSDIVDKPLKQISFPKEAILAGIIRGDDIIIPTGDSVIRSGDHIIIFARKRALPKVEKILSVKLDYF
jgi:trk system potassium uptake protein TrkA